MSVFMLERREAPKKVAPDTVTTVAAPGNSEEMPAEAVSPTKDGKDDGKVAALSQGEAGLAEADIEKATQIQVKIDGPLGRVFTDALNRLLVQESYITMLPAVMDDLVKKSKQNDGPSNIHVYHLEGAVVDMADVIGISDEAARDPNSTIVIAVESTQTSKALELLAGVERAYPNVKLCLSAESAARAVIGKLYAR